jgi:hypothetical protein
LVLIGQSMNPGPIPRELNDRSPRRAGSYPSGGEVGDRRGQTATLVNRPGAPTGLPDLDRLALYAKSRDIGRIKG